MFFYITEYVFLYNTISTAGISVLTTKTLNYYIYYIYPPLLTAHFFYIFDIILYKCKVEMIDRYG